MNVGVGKQDISAGSRLMVVLRLDELAPWRCTRHKIGEQYIREYLKHMPRSEPADDFADRNLLYVVLVNGQLTSMW